MRGRSRVAFSVLKTFAVNAERWLVDVAGSRPAGPCLERSRKFNLSRCFGCAYQFKPFLDCSKDAPNFCQFARV